MKNLDHLGSLGCQLWYLYCIIFLTFVSRMITFLEVCKLHQNKTSQNAVFLCPLRNLLVFVSLSASLDTPTFHQNDVMHFRSL